MANMSAASIQQMAERVSVLIEEKLGARGPGLADKAKRAGRALPGKVRAAALRLAEAAAMSHNPKLLLQLDEERVAADFDICVRHLSSISVGDRWVGRIVNFGASTVITVLIVLAMVVAFVYWRGLA
jgi:hypothetical protein